MDSSDEGEQELAGETEGESTDRQQAAAIDAEKLADKVYGLMLAEVRLEIARQGRATARNAK